MGTGQSKPAVDAKGPNQPSAVAAGDAGTSQNKKKSTLSDFKTVYRTAHDYCDSKDRQALALSSKEHSDIIYEHPYIPGERKKAITRKLMKAVANGMESRAVNVAPQQKDLFAEDLLRRSPEYLLEKGADFKDWGGRTFKEPISAFQYALWAKDFKMIEMMLRCIPANAEGDRIREGLLEQYEQVMAPVHAGGGLTYELTYDWPVQDANGIPLKDAAGAWQTTPVTKVHTENHFDLRALIKAYQDYLTHFNVNVDGSSRTSPERDACWVKGIGTLQRLLPVNMLQRYCDPDIPFYPLPSFTSGFRRTVEFFNYVRNTTESLFSSTLSFDFSLYRGRAEGDEALGTRSSWGPTIDLAAVRQLDEVSTNEIEKIKQQLTTLGQSPTQFRP